MRGSFQEDAALSDRLFDLLDQVFPGIRQGASEVRRLGAAWESVSVPFIEREGDKVVAHVGLIELPLVLQGAPTVVGTVHAVATDPERRGRGLFRRLMEETLAWAADHYETLILTTDHPEYYEAFGFRHLPEHCFRVPRPTESPAAPGEIRASWRRLDLHDPFDVALLNRLLEHRQPVSRRVGVGPEKAIFFFNEGRRPLQYVEDLDVILCAEAEGATLKLFDIVGARLPSQEELWARMPPTTDELILHFAPDRIAPDLVTPDAGAEAYLLDHDGPSYLMARGPFAAEGEPFTLPRSART